MWMVWYRSHEYSTWMKVGQDSWNGVWWVVLVGTSLVVLMSDGI